MIYLPFLGAVALATGTILEKVILLKKKIDIKTYQTVSFLAIILTMLPFIYFFWKLDTQAFSSKNIFIFILVIIFSVLANLFTFYSIKWEKVSKLEPAKALEPLFVIILAIFFSFFFKELYDRNLKIIIPALISAGALIFSHIQRHHLKFNKYFICAILGSFFFALELVLTRLILDFYSPTTFYFLRCSSIFLISFIFLKPKFSEVKRGTAKHILITGFVWVIYRIIVYYGYLKLGVIFTTLILMLGPAFVYFFAWKFLKEKPTWKNILATAIIDRKSVV